MKQRRCASSWRRSASPWCSGRVMVTRAEDELAEVSSTTLPFHNGAVSVVKILQHHDACVGAEVEVPEHVARRE